MLCGSVCVCMSQAVNVDSHKQSFVEACEVHLREGDRRLAQVCLRSRLIRLTHTAGDKCYFSVQTA